MMSKQTTEVTSVSLAHTKNGMIRIAHIEKPYGESSSPVASVVISLDGEGEDWKVHIPYENLDEVIKGLEAAQALCDKMGHTEPHTMDLDADTGGGGA